MIGTKVGPLGWRSGNEFLENACWQKLHKGTERNYIFVSFLFQQRERAAGRSENSAKMPMNSKNMAG
jgi:hypothetical protein